MQIILLLAVQTCQAVLFSIKTPETDRVWSGYQVYQPSVSNGVVIDTDNNALDLRYNHCASTAFYSNRWYTVWNANTVEAEGQYGQLIYLATSTNFTDWSTPIPVFSSSASCSNPLGASDLGSMMQWQPNLQVVGNELWCTWSESGSNTTLRGTYFSRLTSPTGLWENTSILLPGDNGLSIYPLIDGIQWRCFPTQNPTVLSSGRVLAPVTMRNRYGVFTTAEKRNAVLYSDDNGNSWQLSELIELPTNPAAQWEPTPYELPSGDIAMIARRLDKFDIAPWEILLYATSPDHGETWSDYETISLETLSARMHVLDTGDRFCMIYNDHRNGDASRSSTVDRYNLSLFTSLTGSATDWIPGISLTHNLYGVAYPQMFEQDDDLFIVFSQGNSRSIHTARVSPKPSTSAHYIYPRHLSNSRLDVRNGMLSFDYKQLVKSKWDMDLGTGNFSISARLVPRARGVLLDGRSDGRGVVVSMKAEGDELALSLSIQGYSTIFNSTSTVPMGIPAYIGVSCENGNSVRMHVNGNTEVFPMTSTENISNGAPLFFGQIQLTNSSLIDLYGQIDNIRIYDRALSDTEHVLLMNGSAVTNGLQLELDSNTFDNSTQFTIDPDECFEDTVYGNDIKRVRGQGSAAVEVHPHDLSTGDSVLLHCNYQTSAPHTNIVLCTIGDAEDPLRVELTAEGMVVVRDQTGVRKLTPHQSQVDTALDILINQGGTTITVNGRSAFISRPFNPARFFIGQGYLENFAPTSQTFLIRINQIETRVY